MWSVVVAFSLMNLVQPAESPGVPGSSPAVSQPAAPVAAAESPIPAPAQSAGAPAPQAVPVSPPANAGPAMAAPVQPDAPQIITNYWQHINELLAMEAARRTKYDLKVKAKYPPPRTYPFDAFQHLKAKDLLRAADEGILAAREKTGIRQDEEVEHQAEVNVNTALEYYPLLAAEESDFTELRYRIQASDPVMQIYLLRRIVPGLANQSLLSEYLQENARRQREEVRKTLLKICGDIMANEKVQCVAFDAAYRFLLEEYLDVYRKDPSVAAYEKQNGKPAPAKLALESGGIQLAPDTLAALEPVGVGFHAYVDALAGQLSPSAGRPTGVWVAARQGIENVYTELYLTNREKIKAILDQYPAPALKGH